MTKTINQIGVNKKNKLSMKQDISKLGYLLYQIKEPIVCVKCSNEYSSGVTDAKSLQKYSSLDVGFTSIGLQIWCRRHEVNVCHIDFGDKKPKIDFRCLEKK